MSRVQKSPEKRSEAGAKAALGGKHSHAAGVERGRFKRPLEWAVDPHLQIEIFKLCEQF